jgi:hypothetical protein
MEVSGSTADRTSSVHVCHSFLRKLPSNLKNMYQYVVPELNAWLYQHQKNTTARAYSATSQYITALLTHLRRHGA